MGTRSYPAPQYNFTGQIDAGRAYLDYKAFTGSHMNEVGSVMSFKQWMQTPIFVVSCQQEPGSQSNILTVNTTASNNFMTAGTTNIYICALYEKDLTITYSESGTVAATSTSSIV
jgi:hypothetical protein